MDPAPFRTLVESAIPATPANLLLLAGLALLPLAAYRFRALDGPGAIAAFVLGAVIALLGGWGWLALLVVFTLAGFIATRVARQEKQQWRVAEANGGTRGLSNVVANGLAAGLAAFTITFAPEPAPALAYATAIAAVTADTLGSELGVLAPRPRNILPPFQERERGQNGAVSAIGQASALAGAITIGALAVTFLGIPWHLAWVPALAGFAGSQLDSLLGATLERDHLRDGPLSKADVNFIASAVPAFVVFVVFSLL